MRLIKQDDNYLLMDGENIIANTGTDQVSDLATGKFCLDLEQINTLLPIKDDDDFQIETIVKGGVYPKNPNLVINLKRSLKTIRNLKLETILKK
jgi:hypothetical protein